MSRPGAIPFVWLLPLLLAAQPVATDSYLPALPAIAQQLGSASLSLTVFVLAFGFGQLPCGPLSDRFGRRPVMLGHAVYVSGHGIHQPCGQAGAVGDLPHLAGRAVSWSGFGMMVVAFAVGQIAASFFDPAFTHGAWPMVVPMVVAGVVIVLIAFLWLPRIHSTFKKEPR